MRDWQSWLSRLWWEISIKVSGRLIMIQSGGGLRYQLRIFARFSSVLFFLWRGHLSRTQCSIFSYYCQSFFPSFSYFFSFSSLHDRFIEFSGSPKKGLRRWKSNEVHATHIRVKVEESEQQNERAQVANHQRGKRYEIDSVVATTFQTTLLVRYSCRFAVRTRLKTGVFASRTELVRKVHQ